ncbi:MAG: ABC transporter ATP-binding protein/permease [Spirochaetaceae bacterium]|jgi:ATP-binding cassette subfamily B protein|nr:ABC transporter ATP-binding protein/permease [Spirochaetaceae bacterium]
MKKTNTDVSLLLPYFTQFRFKYAAGFLCLITVDAAQMLIPQYIRSAVNAIASGAYLLGGILRIALAMTATMFVVASGRFLWRYFIHGSSRRIEALLRERLFSHLLTLSGDFFQRYKTGDLMARITNDTGAVRLAVGWGLVGLVDGTIMASAILVTIFIQNGSTAALAVMPLPLITGLIILFGKMIGPRFVKAQAAYSAMSGAVQESFAGSRVIKSFVKENFFTKKFAGINDTYAAANIGVVKVHGFFFPLITFFSGITGLIVVFAGGRRVILGTMSPGDFVALFSYIQMLIWPVFGAGFTVNMIQRGHAALKRIQEILQTAPRIQSEAAAPPPGWPYMNTPDVPAIELRGVSFAYTDADAAADAAANADVDAVLKDIRFSLPRGAWLGIMGRTGSGKSTLIKLFTRLVEAPRGAVFVHGADVRDIPLKDLRALFGVSPQDSYLFSDSVRANIRYGFTGNADEGEALAARMIEISALSGDMAELPAGADTQIGERGVVLSGGQKQRLSIARAALVEPEILILDDALSAVDAETERRILTRLAEARDGKTTIIVSHRVSAFRSADFVAVLDGGALTEFGPPAALLNAGGYYAKTARLQQLSAG